MNLLYNYKQTVTMPPNLLMKKKLFSILLAMLMLAIITHEKESEEIKVLFCKWKGLHNTQKISSFQAIAATSSPILPFMATSETKALL